jgi:hypothetical protein
MNPVDIVVAQTVTVATLTDMLIALSASIMILEMKGTTIINPQHLLELCSKETQSR